MSWSGIVRSDARRSERTNSTSARFLFDMRRFLDRLYRASGFIAGILVLVLALAVLAQIFGRLVGVVVPGVIQGAGFLMVAIVFLALAYTQAASEHIRVSLVIENVSERWNWWIELWCLTFSACIIAYYAVYSGQQAWESWLFNYSSDGMVAIPTSIPQGIMTVGLAIFCIRLIDDLFRLTRTKTPQYLATKGTVAHRASPDDVGTDKQDTKLRK